MIEKTITIKAAKNWQSKPTKPGMYLIRTNKIEEEIVMVHKSAVGLAVLNSKCGVEFLDEPKFTNCKWFGPIKNS